ncbi:MAG: hypothetical protein U0528_07120 [Anaerolineae bacterium]
MSELFTIELTEDTARHAREVASRVGQSIETLLSEWIERAAEYESLAPLKPGVEYPIYTPVGNEAAAAVLIKLLNDPDATNE